MLTLSSDNAGPEVAASLEKGVPIYASMMVDAMEYHPRAIGNHELDSGCGTVSRRQRTGGFEGRSCALG